MTIPLTKLGLGSSQFGLDAASPPRGRPRDAEVRDILSIAARSGLQVLEIARHAQAAETLLGQVMPRPQPFRMTLTTVRPDRGADFAEAELRAQMRRLGVES